MNIDALPVPKLQNAMDPVHIRTVSKILGVALVAQWVLPWMKMGPATLMSWDLMKLAGFMAIWPLLAGGALLAFGFVKPGVIKRGVMVAAGAGIGVLGIFSVATGFSIFPFTYTFGFLGIATLAFGLLMWIRQGHSQLTWIVTIVGASMMLLGLLIPVGGMMGMGSEMPLIALFKVFSGGAGIILGSIFFFLFGLVYIAIIAGTVMFVILPQAAATEGWIKLLFNALMVFFPVAFIVTFLFAFTDGLPLYGLHMAVLTGAYLWLTVSCGMSVFEAVKDGSIKSWF